MNEQKRPQPNNDDLYNLLSAYLDDAVTGPERAQVEQAVAESPETAAELESLRQTVALLAELPSMPAPRPFTLTAADVGEAAPPRKKFWFPLPGWLGGLAAAAVALLCVLAAGGLLLAGPMGMSGSAPAEVALQRESAAPAAEANMAAEAEAADSAAAEMAAGAAPVEEAAPPEPQEAPMMAVEATAQPQELPAADAAAEAAPLEEPAVEEKAAAAEALPPQAAPPVQESAAAESEEALRYAEEPAGDEAMLAAPTQDDAARGIGADEVAPAPELEMAAPAPKEAVGAAAAETQAESDAALATEMAPAESAPAGATAVEGEPAAQPAGAVEAVPATVAPQQNNLTDQAVPQSTILPPTLTLEAKASPAATPAAPTPAERSLISRALVTVLAFGVILALAALGLGLLLRRKSGRKG